jgi:hypothetical protein
MGGCTAASRVASSAASRLGGRSGRLRRSRRAGSLRGGLARRQTWLRRGVGARRGPRAARKHVERSLSDTVAGSHTKTAPHRCREGPFATSSPRYSVRPPMHEIPRPMIIIRPREVLRRRTLCDMVRSVYRGQSGRQGFGRFRAIPRRIVAPMRYCSARYRSCNVRHAPGAGLTSSPLRATKHAIVRSPRQTPSCTRSPTLPSGLPGS